MKMACVRCWDKDCSCTAEEVAEFRELSSEALKKRDKWIEDNQVSLGGTIIVGVDRYHVVGHGYPGEVFVIGYSIDIANH